MEYFQSPLPRYGDGFCSDWECPCNETRIPVGEGYLYISRECCAFRWDCRTTDEVHTKAERLSRESGATIIGPGIAVPILVCEVGARKRGLDLEFAARDAKHWWATQQVPFRPTPRVGEPEVAFTSQAATSQTSDPFVLEVRALPPSGRPSSQAARLNKPLVHLLVLKEGIAPPLSDLKELFESLETDVRADSPTMVSLTTGNTWPETPVDFALASLARDRPEYVSKEYDVRTDELRHKDGTRMVIVKVFANRPKIVNPTAPAQQNTLAIEVPHNIFGTKTIVFTQDYVTDGKRKIFYRDATKIYYYALRVTTNFIFISHSYDFKVGSADQEIDVSMSSEFNIGNAKRKEIWQKLVGIASQVIQPRVVENLLRRIFVNGEAVRIQDLELTREGYSRGKLFGGREQVLWTDAKFAPKFHVGNVIIWGDKHSKTDEYFHKIPMDTPNAVVVPELMKACVNAASRGYIPPA